MKRQEVGLTLAALLWLAPLYFMLVFATRPEADIFHVPIPLTPGSALGANIASLEHDVHFTRTLLNSLAIASLSTVLGLLVSSMAGYAFAHFRFRGQKALFTIVLGTLTIPYFVVVIPQFILVAAWLQLSNTYWAAVLPPLANSLGVFYMRQNFQAVPAALIEAARLDGAGEFRIFFQIVLPLVRPALGALAIILFLGSWNDYLWPLLILPDRAMTTAPVALGSLIGLTRVSWGGIMAGALLMTLPLLLLFLLLQRQILSGMTSGAVKE
jgi:lactose/L-arabinose transport system permease protein